MARKTAMPGDPVIIKKYANRRLYNTASSGYITLDDLARMTREGTDFQVVDAKTGDDITHAILTQIIMEEEANGQQMLPISFLRQLIGLYGNSMQSLMPQYLEASMENFRANQSRLSEFVERGIGNNPIAKIAETNLALMRVATEALLPGRKTDRPSQSATDGTASELDEMRAQMAAMQEKLDRMSE